MSAFPKMALLVDGLNLHFAARALGFDIDFVRLLAEFEKRGTLVRAYYYSTILEDGGDSNIRPLTDWLNYNGFTVVAKSRKTRDDCEGRRMFERNIGVELSVHALEIAKLVDQIVLFSGDGDLQSLVKALQRKGRRVTVVSTLKTKPTRVTAELRRQADEFLELDTLRDTIGRPIPSEAAQ
jgi:uncharacterized LabA/DUF88 family protein